MTTRWLANVLAVVALALAGLGIWSWATATTPPSVDTSHVEPLVADAIAAARMQAARSPRSVVAWGHLGMTLHAHAFLKEARFAYAEAERLDDSDAAWPYLIGDCYWAEAQSEEALAAFRRASGRTGADSVALVRLGETAFELGRTDEAVRAFEQVTRNLPDEPRTRLGLGRIALVKGDLPSALKHVRAALSSAGDVPPALRFLARALYATGDEVAARQALARVARSPFAWPDVYLDEKGLRHTGGVGIARKSRMLYLSGHSAEALELHKEYVKRYPDAVEAQVGLGRMYVLMRMPDLGEPHLRAALALNPDLVDVRYSLGAALKDQGNCAGAIVEFRAVIAAQPDFADAYFELGRCLDRLGDKKAAVAQARHSLELEPDDIEVRKYLGGALFDLGQFRGAVDVLTQAAVLAPNDAEVRSLLARAVAKMP